MRRRELVASALYAAILAETQVAHSALLPPSSFLTGLNHAQDDHALHLHEESIVINCHDHMWRLQDYVDMSNGGVTLKIYKPLADGIYWDDMNRRVFPADPFDWTAKYLEAVEKVEAIEKSGQPPLLIIRKLEDVSRLKRERKIGVILGNEGSLPLGESLERFEQLYQRGLRELAPYWPAGNHTRHVLDQQGNLTTFAKHLIEKASTLGVVLDSSHLAAAPAFRQLLELSKGPVIHTHGAARFPRTRAVSEGDLEDDQIRAIANKGGIIGLHFCTYIRNLNGWYWSPTVDDLVDHVEYLVKVGGIDCVGIGADHFPYNSKPIMKPFQESAGAQIEDRDWGKTFVVGLHKISAMPLFTQALVSRGFPDGDIRKILGLNALRVLKEAWKA